MSQAQVEFAVIGGGLVGLSTARELARRGREVLLLERDSLGNDRSGSKGTARIFRFGYDEPLYVRMAMASKPMWRELESETGRSLLTDTGQISFAGDLEVLRSAMESAGAPVETIDGPEVKRRAPGLDIGRSRALFEPESGVLGADRCLRALEESASSSGLQISEHSRVVSVENRPDDVELVVESGDARSEVRASVAIVCAGHWTARLLRASGIDLSLVSTLEQAVHLAQIAGKECEVPVFIERTSPWVYGLPVATPGLLKVALHHAGPVADPDLSPLDPDPGLLSLIADHTERLLPGHHPEPVSSERCFYDTTSDEDFVIDRIGRLVVGAGTSGHGFKFGPLLGELLADLALDETPRFDLGRFSSRRSAVAGS